MGANIIEAGDAQQRMAIRRFILAFTVYLLSSSVGYCYCSDILNITLLALIFKTFSDEFFTGQERRRLFPSACCFYLYSSIARKVQASRVCKVGIVMNFD